MNIMNALGEKAVNWNRTELYLNIDNATGPFNAIIYNETAINTVWKYIVGRQAYTDYYYCNQTAFGPSNLTEAEWVFNISDTPYEYEEQNLVHVYPNKGRQLRQMIQNQMNNAGFEPDQDRTVYNDALPEFGHGVWAPWIK
eukprot:UN11105